MRAASSVNIPARSTSADDKIASDAKDKNFAVFIAQDSPLGYTPLEHLAETAASKAALPLNVHREAS